MMIDFRETEYEVRSKFREDIYALQLNKDDYIFDNYPNFY